MACDLRSKGTVQGKRSTERCHRIGFLLTAADSDISAGGTVDGFRLKITDPTGAVVYDNKLGTTDDMNSSTQQISGEDIVIYKS